MLSSLEQQNKIIKVFPAMLNQVDSRRQDLQIPTQALQSTYWTIWAKLFNLFAAAPLSLKWRHMKLSLPWHPSLGVLDFGLGAFGKSLEKSQGCFQLIDGVDRDQAVWHPQVRHPWASAGCEFTLFSSRCESPPAWLLGAEQLTGHCPTALMSQLHEQHRLWGFLTPQSLN